MKEEDEIEFLTRWQRNVIAHNRLRDAAPELLEALEALESAVLKGVDADPEVYRHAHTLASAAIAKAKGGTK